MQTYKTIDAFLDDLTPIKKEQVQALRGYIQTAEPLLEEHIKWNAPSYVYNGEDRITFNLSNKEGVVKLVFHMGATRKEDRNSEPVLNDTPIVTWVSDIRGYATFKDIDEIRSQKAIITDIVKRWIKV